MYPNITDISQLTAAMQSNLVACFKCDASGWSELVTGDTGTNSSAGTLGFQASALGLYEMICNPANNDHCYFATTAAQLIANAFNAPFSFFVCTTDVATDQLSTAIIGSGPYQSRGGWTVAGEQYNNTGDVGLTKWNFAGNQDIAFSNLESSNVTSYIAGAINSDSTSDFYTNEGAQNSSNAVAFTSGDHDRFTIGGFYREWAFTAAFSGRIGPYIFLWSDVKSAGFLQGIAADPASIISGASNILRPGLQKLGKQFSPISAIRLGGVLEQ